MSFKVNSSQQISFNDSVFSLTAREKKALDNSWAKIFADEIFPNIDEERFSVLYSSKASRPNAPVNVIIGALIIKELFDYSDDEIVENLMLDLHLQYALHGMQHSLLQRMLQTGQRAKGICKVKNSAIMQSLGMA